MPGFEGLKLFEMPLLGLKVGVGTVEDLAEVEPARVRLWVQAAREANRSSATRPSS